MGVLMIAQKTSSLAPQIRYRERWVSVNVAMTAVCSETKSNINNVPANNNRGMDDHTCTAFPSIPIFLAISSLVSLEGFSFSLNAISKTSNSRVLVFRRRLLTKPGLSIIAFSSGFSG